MKVYRSDLDRMVERIIIYYCERCDIEYNENEGRCPVCGVASNSSRREYFDIDTGEKL